MKSPTSHKCSDCLTKISFAIQVYPFDRNRTQQDCQWPRSGQQVSDQIYDRAEVWCTAAQPVWAWPNYSTTSTSLIQPINTTIEEGALSHVTSTTGGVLGWRLPPVPVGKEVSSTGMGPTPLPRCGRRPDREKRTHPWPTLLFVATDWVPVRICTSIPQLCPVSSDLRLRRLGPATLFFAGSTGLVRILLLPPVLFDKINPLLFRLPFFPNVQSKP